MVDTTVTWSFFSWLFVGLWASATSAWLIGDLTMLYWIPRLTKTNWMLNPRPKQLLWTIAHIMAVIAHWFVWKDNGGWPGALGPLLIGFIFVAFTVIWHLVLYCYHQIRIAFWVSVVVAALALVTTIWFWILGTAPGVLMLFVLIWVFYISLWNFQLVRLNTVAGRVQRAGTNQTLEVQTSPTAVPPPAVWSSAGRRCPYDRQFRKFRQGDRLRAGPAIVRPGDAVDVFGSAGRQGAAVGVGGAGQQQQQQQQPCAPVGQQTYMSDIGSMQQPVQQQQQGAPGFGNTTTFGQYASRQQYGGGNQY